VGGEEARREAAERGRPSAGAIACPPPIGRPAPAQGGPLSPTLGTAAWPPGGQSPDGGGGVGPPPAGGSFGAGGLGGLGGGGCAGVKKKKKKKKRAPGCSWDGGHAGPCHPRNITASARQPRCGASRKGRSGPRQAPQKKSRWVWGERRISFSPPSPRPTQYSFRKPTEILLPSTWRVTLTLTYPFVRSTHTRAAGGTTTHKLLLSSPLSLEISIHLRPPEFLPSSPPSQLGQDVVRGGHRERAALLQVEHLDDAVLDQGGVPTGPDAEALVGEVELGADRLGKER